MSRNPWRPDFRPQPTDGWTGQSPATRKAAWDAQQKARMRQATATPRRSFWLMIAVITFVALVAAVTILFLLNVGK